jgi:hypothetical protein
VFIAGINDSGEKLLTGVNGTGDKLSPVSLYSELWRKLIFFIPEADNLVTGSL